VAFHTVGVLPKLVPGRKAQPARRLVLILAGAALLCSCRNRQDPTLPAEIYVFPKLKYTGSAGFSLTRAERKVAVRHVERLKGELLYELVVDRTGNVIKIRTIKSLPGSDTDFYTIGFRQHLEQHKFKPSKLDAPYRTFFYPMNVQSSTEFLGTQGFID
jgi:hypothetical protein